MAKKHKKIFKQKIKEMLSQAEKAEPVLPSKLEIPKEPAGPPPLEKPTKIEKVPKPKEPEPVTSSLTPVSIVKSDLKKITLLTGIMVLILIASAIVFAKTNWLLILADKIYNLAQLSS